MLEQVCFDALMVYASRAVFIVCTDDGLYIIIFNAERSRVASIVYVNNIAMLYSKTPL